MNTIPTVWGRKVTKLLRILTRQVGSNILKKSGSKVYFYKRQTPFMGKLKNFMTHDIQSSTYSD